MEALVCSHNEPCLKEVSSTSFMKSHPLKTFLTHLTIVTITRGKWNLFSYVNNQFFCSPWFSGLPISTVDNLAFCKRLISDQGLSENPIASLYEIVSETDAKRTDGHHLTFLLNTIIIVA